MTGNGSSLPSAMELTARLADWAWSARYEDLPPSTVRVTKRFVLDTLGTGLAGTAAPAMAEVAGLVRRWGGTPEARIWGSRDMVPAQNAALANSALAHALDYDDTHDYSEYHACVPVVPAALAMAERERPVDGRTFLVATTIGIELGIRLAMAVKRFIHRGFLPTTLCGVFGAAAASARLNGLSRERLHDALGLAYSQAGGNRQALLDGALAKRIQPGFAAQEGVVAAELAGAGVTGARWPIEGAFGLGTLYAGGRLDSGLLLDGLGLRYEVENLTCKLYPCCYSTYPAINGVLALRARFRLRPDDVESVHIRASQTVQDLVGRPFEIRENPQVDAQFSNGYTVAVALMKGFLEIEDFAPDTVVANLAAQGLAARIRTEADPRLGEAGTVKAVVEITTTDGHRYREEVLSLKGGPNQPLSKEELIAKFRDCASSAVPPLSPGNQDQVVNYIDRLEDSSDVSQLVTLLAGQGTGVTSRQFRGTTGARARR